MHNIGYVITLIYVIYKSLKKIINNNLSYIHMSVDFPIKTFNHFPSR